MSWSGEMPGIPGTRLLTVDALPSELEGAVQVGPHSQAKPGALLRVVPGVGRFLVTEGTTVLVAPEPGVDPAMVEAFLFGGVQGALIYQRGEFPLHGSTVIPPDGGDAVAITGNSGMGKSTLAAELVRRGWSLLADDLTRVTWKGGHALAWPGRPGIKLMPDACERLGITTAGLEAVGSDVDKLLWMAPARREPRPLGLIFILHDEDAPEQELLTGIPSLALLSEQTFRPNYLDALGVRAPQLQLVANLTTRCRVIRANRRCGPAELATRVNRLRASSAEFAPYFAAATTTTNFRT